MLTNYWSVLKTAETDTSRSTPQNSGHEQSRDQDCSLGLHLWVKNGVTSCLENLEMSGYLTAARKLSRNWPKVREMSRIGQFLLLSLSVYIPPKKNLLRYQTPDFTGQMLFLSPNKQWNSESKLQALRDQARKNQPLQNPFSMHQLNHEQTDNTLALRYHIWCETCRQSYKYTSELQVLWQDLPVWIEMKQSMMLTHGATSIGPAFLSENQIIIIATWNFTSYNLNCT